MTQLALSEELATTIAATHPELSAALNQPIRSRVVEGHVMYYVATGSPRMILGILHGRRDIDTLMRTRINDLDLTKG